jgi:hypothetical protein
MTPTSSIAADIKIDMASMVRRADPNTTNNEKGDYDCDDGNEAEARMEAHTKTKREDNCTPNQMKYVAAKKGQLAKLPFDVWSPSSVASTTSSSKTFIVPPSPLPEAEGVCCKEPPLTKENLFRVDVDDIAQTRADETVNRQSCSSSSSCYDGDQDGEDDIMSDSGMTPGAAIKDDAFVNPFLYSSQRAYSDRGVDRVAGASARGQSLSQAASSAFKKQFSAPKKLTRAQSERGVTFTPTAECTSEFKIQTSILKSPPNNNNKNVARATAIPPSTIIASPALAAKAAFERRRSLRRAQSKRGVVFPAGNRSGGRHAQTRRSPPPNSRKQQLAFDRRNHSDLRRAKSERDGVIGSVREALGDIVNISPPGGQHQLYPAPPHRRAASDPSSTCISPMRSPLFRPTRTPMPDPHPPLSYYGANIDMFASPRQVHMHMLEVEEKMQAARPRTYQLDHQQQGPTIKDSTSHVDRAAAWPILQEEHNHVPDNTTFPCMPYLCQGWPATMEAQPQVPLHAHFLAPTSTCRRSVHKQHRSCSLSCIPEHPIKAGFEFEYPAHITEYGTRQLSWSQKSSGGSSTSRPNHTNSRGSRGAGRQPPLHQNHCSYTYSKAPTLESILMSGEEDEGDDELNHDERTPLLLAPKGRRDPRLKYALSHHSHPQDFLYPSFAGSPTSSFRRRLSKEHHNMGRSAKEVDAFMHQFQLLQEKDMGKCSWSHARCDFTCAIFFVVQLIVVFVLGTVELFHNLASYDGAITSPDDSDSDRALFFETFIGITLGCGVFASLLGGGMLFLILMMMGDDRKLIPVSLMLTIFLSFSWGILGARVLPSGDNSCYSPAPALGFVVCMICIGYAVVIWPRIPWSSANLHAALVGIRLASPTLWMVALVAQVVLLVWSLWWTFTVVGVYDHLSGAQKSWVPLALSVTLVFMVVSCIWTFQVIVVRFCVFFPRYVPVSVMYFPGFRCHAK